MDDFCPRCGTMFALEWNLGSPQRRILCAGCALAVKEPPKLLAPSTAEGGEMAYNLAD